MPGMPVHASLPALARRHFCPLIPASDTHVPRIHVRISTIAVHEIRGATHQLAGVVDWNMPMHVNNRGNTQRRCVLMVCRRTPSRGQPEKKPHPRPGRCMDSAHHRLYLISSPSLRPFLSRAVSPRPSLPPLCSVPRPCRLAASQFPQGLGVNDEEGATEQ